jgi:hypothetical protein
MGLKISRFSDIEKPLLTNQPSLEERLKQYPELKGKIEAMLAIIENAGGGCGESGRSGEADYRAIAADGERAFPQLGPAVSGRKNKSTTPSRA